MNTYLLYTRDGRGWITPASNSDRAIAKVEAASGLKVSSWQIGLAEINPRYFWNITRLP